LAVVVPVVEVRELTRVVVVPVPVDIYITLRQFLRLAL
jgi:hypothetical protein